MCTERLLCLIERAPLSELLSTTLSINPPPAHHTHFLCLKKNALLPLDSERRVERAQFTTNVPRPLPASVQRDARDDAPGARHGRATLQQHVSSPCGVTPASPDPARDGARRGLLRLWTLTPPSPPDHKPTPRTAASRPRARPTSPAARARARCRSVVATMPCQLPIERAAAARSISRAISSPPSNRRRRRRRRCPAPDPSPAAAHPPPPPAPPRSAPATPHQTNKQVSAKGKGKRMFRGPGSPMQGPGGAQMVR